MSALLQSYQNLNLTYVDLMLIHYPSDESQVNREMWNALEDSVDMCLVKSIEQNFNGFDFYLISDERLNQFFNRIDCNFLLEV